ncbi:MAG: PAS domain S-box protein [Phycisphaerales bacterium]|nr:PAS domain S-box protein [Phycisphaerales bacterium]
MRKTLKSWLSKLNDSFVPPMLRDAPLEERRRAQMIMWFWLAVTLWAPVYAVLYHLLGDDHSATVAAIGGMSSIIIPIVLRRTGSLLIAGNVFVSLLLAVITNAIFITGGVHSPAVVWLALIPLLAATMAGTRAALTWSGVTVAVITVVHFLDARGHSFHVHISPDGLDFLHYFVIATAVILICSLACTHESLQRRAIRESQEFTDRLRRALADNNAITEALQYTNNSLAAQITERRSAEVALRKQEQLLNNVLSTIPYCVFWKDRDSVYLGCNANFATAAGLKQPDDIRGLTDHDLPWTKEETANYVARDQQVIETGRPLHNFESNQHQADGRCAQILVSKVPLRDDHGDIFGVLGVYVDITERKEMEERSRLQSSALEAAGNAVLITDTNGRIIWANPAFTQMTGYTREDAVGKNPRILKSGEQPRAFYESLWNTIRAGGKWHGELVNRRKDGTLYPEEMTIAPVRNQLGAITHYVALKQDITDRIRAGKLTAERDQLREAVKAHEHLLGVVGHELRTPLAGMTIAAEFLLTEHARDTNQFDTFLHCIHDEVQRMSGMVNDMLEVARLNSGIAKWNWGEFEIVTACNDAAVPIERLIDSSRVRLSIDVQPADLRMRGDASAIRRLVQNLLSNASKHTTDGSISVTAREITENNQRFIELCVCDTGSGMSAETAARLGEAFALNSGVVGEKYVSGSGLGLAICRGIVDAHGGRITIASKIQEGTTCTVRLHADLSTPKASDTPVEIVSESRR